MPETKIDIKLEDTYGQLPAAMYSRVMPTKVKAPALVLFNHKLAAELGLPAHEAALAAWEQILAGNAVPEGWQPLAMAYQGHQFGYPNMLGDGRALLLGELLKLDGQRVDIQLKGAGLTPYSRRGDGRAALGSMLREYLYSEALHGLGIPTTRSLAVVATGQPVFREKMEAGAVLTRIAASHIRVGTFEYAVNNLSLAEYQQFLQYTIKRHYPALTDAPAEGQALAFLQAVMERQASLVAQWMGVGFIHGVMNTDNMSIAGQTIDYGPCAFMNTYHPNTVFSSIDTGGRYAYGQQPGIAHWNLAVLAGTLLPLIHENEEQATVKAQETLQEFPRMYLQAWMQVMRNKLGLAERQQDDKALVIDLLDWMQANAADYTNTFVHLQLTELPLLPAYQQDDFKLWYQRWRQRTEEQPGGIAAARKIMQQHNPQYIARNYLVEEALQQATELADLKPLMQLLDILSQPYQQQAVADKYTQPPTGGDAGYKTFCNT